MEQYVTNMLIVADVRLRRMWAHNKRARSSLYTS